MRTTASWSGHPKVRLASDCLVGITYPGGCGRRRLTHDGRSASTAEPRTEQVERGTCGGGAPSESNPSGPLCVLVLSLRFATSAPRPAQEPDLSHPGHRPSVGGWLGRSSL